MKKRNICFLTLGLLLANISFGQKALFDSLTAEILKDTTIIDTFSVKKYNPKVLKEGGKIGDGLIMRVKSGSDKYDYDIPIGLWTFYYKNGKVRKTIFLNKELKPQGIKLEYYKNGNLYNEINYGINKNNNCCNYYGKWYDKNGKILFEGEIENGKKTGITKYYTIGILDYIIDYSKDQKKIVKCKKQ